MAVFAGLVIADGNFILSQGACLIPKPLPVREFPDLMRCLTGPVLNVFSVEKPSAPLLFMSSSFSKQERLRFRSARARLCFCCQGLWVRNMHLAGWSLVAISWGLVANDGSKIRPLVNPGMEVSDVVRSNQKVGSV